MRLSDLDYELPPELIAQEPPERRDHARLLVVDRKARSFEHSRFDKLARHLREGDLLVLNDTRVFPARLRVQKPSGGKVELLMIQRLANDSSRWLALVRSRRPLTAGSELILPCGARLKVEGFERPGRVIVSSVGPQSLEEIINQCGELALPPYIRRVIKAEDAERYQTVYASNTGSVAAPTAGLHFTEQLLSDLAKEGINSARLTLHIGPGTFVPIRTEQVERHSMEPEWYVISPSTVEAIEHTRRTGGRVIAVGTSTVRALESYAITGQTEGKTGLFVYPGFRFRLVEGMITNFHLPRSTVLAMVMAFTGRELTLAAYKEAIQRRYRFLSYGDAMLIL